LYTHTIKLEKLTFFGFHGLNENEIKDGQNFILNLTLDYNTANNSKDEIIFFIDYTELYFLIKASFKEKRFNLLESLAHKILDDIRLRYDAILYMKLNIRKPSIVIDNNKDFINVEVEYKK